MTQITVDRAVIEQALDNMQRAADTLRWQSLSQSAWELRAALAAEPTLTRPVEYTPPHMGRKPLTDGRIIDISRSLKDGKWSNIEFARAIESAHGITAHTIETDPAKIRAAFEDDDFRAGAV